MSFIQPLKELVTGEAVRPDAINRDASLSARMAGRTVIGASFANDSVRLAPITFDRKGLYTVGTVQTLSFDINRPIPATISSALATLAAKYRTKNLVVSVGGAWFVVGTDTRFAGNSIERNRQLIADPQAVVGQEATSGMLFAPVPNPLQSQSIIFNFPRELVGELVSQLEKDYQVCRVQSGCFSIVSYVVECLLAKTATQQDLLVVDNTGVVLLSGLGNRWGEPAFKSGIEILGQDAAKKAGGGETLGHDAINHAVDEMLSRRENTQTPLAYVNSTGIDLEEHLHKSIPDGSITRLMADQEVSVDIHPAPLPHRPHISRVQMGFAVALVIAALGFGALAFQAAQKNAALIASKATSEQAVAGRQAQLNASKAVLAEADANRKRADRMAQWLTISMNVQPVIATVLDAAPNEVTVDKLLIKLSEGQSQVDISLTLHGKPSSCSNAIDEITNKLASAGVTLASPEQKELPNNEGVRFLGRFLFRPPNQMKWSGQNVASAHSTQP